ncbi:YdcF family protein [Corynebacterium breve]|uniref:YdcF family protein n=1 Tax=Corynebacterium breve TaxID=3049799 RepID=A0ABY8VG10_9CORY|nr:YdcF family protein [Corynebacterium breve]WIM68247.1 YdcF family protein [Corynebacterium breve]
MDPVLVLGAKVIDGRPRPLLEERLAKAMDVVDSADIIVSGRGEAEAMAQWLVDNGFPRERIVVEPRATSTNENLENARALVPDAERFIVVTNNFHVLRTRVWAWHLDIPVQVIGAGTPNDDRIYNYTRELGALPHSISRVVWRRFKRWLKEPMDWTA